MKQWHFFLGLIIYFSPISTAPAYRCISLYDLVLLDLTVWSDKQEVMSSGQNKARKALADFFAATEMQHAHWYQVKEATVGTHLNEVNKAFPSLSTLLSIPEELLVAIEKTAGLVSFRRGVFSSITMAWEALIAEYKLDNELTTFSCGSRPRLLIKVGSWSRRHPGVTPEFIWATKGEYRKPMLRISTLTMAFAATIGNLELIIPTSSNNKSESNDNTEGSSNSGDTTESISDSDLDGVGEVDATAFYTPSIDFPQHEFPLLHSLNIQNESQFNAVIREIVKYKRSNEAIEFIQKNNRPGYLIFCPSSRSLERYSAEISKKKGTIDSLLGVISNSAKCNETEANECLLRSLYKKDEDAFATVALENGFIMDGTNKKMDAVQVEAMISEAGLTKNSSRILFRHLNQFFGRSLFESENKRRSFFAGTEFAPVVNRKVLEDKTVIDYWYKEPDLMLIHQINNIIQQDQLPHVSSVDLTVGGDHGGGKFRMTLKILFRFEDRPSTSRLFQIASVSHSKDETEILRSTVLQPVGESLRRISLGGNFIVFIDCNNELGLSFNLNVSYFGLSFITLVNTISNRYIPFFILGQC